MKVRALKVGFFGQRRRVGDVFEVQTREQLGKWMEVLEDSQEPPRQKRQYRKRGDQTPQ